MGDRLGKGERERKGGRGGRGGRGGGRRWEEVGGGGRRWEVGNRKNFIIQFKAGLANIRDYTRRIIAV